MPLGSFGQGYSFSPYSNYRQTNSPQMGGIGMDLSSIMGMLGSTNPLLSVGALAGGQLLQGIGSLIGGKSPGEQRADKTFRLAQNRLGQSVLNPDQYLADYMRMLTPMINNEATRLGKRTGLDSGVAIGGLFDLAQSPIAQFMTNVKMKNDVLSSQRDDMLLQLMGSLGR